MATTTVRVRVEGDEEVIRALEKLPADAQDAMRHEAKDIATSLTDFIKIAGRNHSRQAARAARNVRQTSAGGWPVIEASNTGRARGLLFGSIFGMKRHTGWYNHARYNHRPGARGQFGVWIGYPGYWFFRTYEDRKPWIETEWQKAGDEVVRRWSA